MNFRSAVLLLLLPAGMACKKPVQSQADPCDKLTYTNHADQHFLDQELQNYQTDNDLPGSLIGVFKTGKQPWIGTTGLSSRENNTPFQPCTPFRIGSITKTFTAVVIMKLLEDGKLTLQDKLHAHLPELDGKIPSTQDISIQMLLNHSSGIIDPKNDDPVYLQDIQQDPTRIGNMSIDQKLEIYVFGKPLHFSPGTNYRYSNSGYWLLGKIAERVAGKSMTALLQEIIFTPLGMQDSYYAKKENNSVANGYFNMGDNLINVTRYDAADGDADPSSGIISNAADLLVFAQALYTGRLVDHSSFERMKEVLPIAGCDGLDCGYGLGMEIWKVGSHTGYGMNGSSIGYDANLIWFPATQTVIISFANKGGGTRKDFLQHILDHN